MPSNEIMPFQMQTTRHAVMQTRHTVAVPSGESSAPPPQSRLVWGSLFTNNAQVYYKSHSLSPGSGGSGVRNCRHKKRTT